MRQMLHVLQGLTTLIEVLFVAAFIVTVGAALLAPRFTRRDCNQFPA